MRFHTIDVTIAKDQCIVYKDYYWLCKNGDPKQALMYSKSPQCNRNKAVLEYGLENFPIYKKAASEGYTITFIELAYIPQDKLFQ